MNAKQFTDKLVKSYPQHLRPDVEFLTEIREMCNRRSLSGDYWDKVYSALVENFRYFPTIQEIIHVIGEVVRRGREKRSGDYAMESFIIDGISYARPLFIDVSGNLIRKHVPLNATRHHIAMPETLVDKSQFISFDEAVDLGYVSEAIIAQMREANKQRRKPKNHIGRFQKIGQIISKEKKEELDVDEWDI